jgi:hypothetical protein
MATVPFFIAVIPSPADAAPGTAGRDAATAKYPCFRAWTKVRQVGRLIEDGIAIRSGLRSGCDAVGYGYRNHDLTYHCFTSGENGTWTHLSDDTTGVQGWVRDSLLTGGGSSHHC